MGLRLNPKNNSIFRFVFVFLLGLVLLLAPAICAQGIGADDTKVGKTGGSIKDLGRRSKDLLASMIEKGGGYLLSYYAVPFAIEHFKISVGTLVMLEFVKPYSTL